MGSSSLFVRELAQRYRGAVTLPLDPDADPELLLLGERPHLTGPEVAAEAGLSYDEADFLRRALGLPHVPPENPAFTAADVDALNIVRQLAESGVVDPRRQLQVTRVLGRSMAALAEAQVAVTIEAGERGVEVDVAELVRRLEAVQLYVWRRHMYAAIQRRAARPGAAAASVAVGFTDLVGYTTRSRDMNSADLDDLLDQFEGRAEAALVDLGGRVVKTLGDEVMWVADSPRDAIDIALALAGPDVRTGVAWGPTLERGGDHFGPTVNVASRLTGLARPGSVLVDRALSTEIAHDPELSIRHLRPVSVRGYDHLSSSVVRRRSG
jgi:adenylate cyclase